MNNKTDVTEPGNAEDGNEGCDIGIVNHTKYQLISYTSDTTWGKFINNSPHKKIMPNTQKINQARGRDSSATGCQIKFSYQLCDFEGFTTLINWAFEKPYDGTNSFSVNFSTIPSNGPIRFKVTNTPEYSPSTEDLLSITSTIEPIS